MDLKNTVKGDEKLQNKNDVADRSSRSDITDPNTKESKSEDQVTYPEGPPHSNLTSNTGEFYSRDSPTLLQRRAFDMEHLLEETAGEDSARNQTQQFSKQALTMSHAQDVKDRLVEQDNVNFEELIDDSDDSEIIEEIIEDDVDEVLCSPATGSAVFTDRNVDISLLGEAGIKEGALLPPTDFSDNANELENLTVEFMKDSSAETSDDVPSLLELNTTSIEEVTGDMAAAFVEGSASDSDDDDDDDSTSLEETDIVAGEEMEELGGSQISEIGLEGMEEIIEGVGEMDDLSATVEQIQNLQEAGDGEGGLILAEGATGENIPLSCLLDEQLPSDMEEAWLQQGTSTEGVSGEQGEHFYQHLSYLQMHFGG